MPDVSLFPSPASGYLAILTIDDVVDGALQTRFGPYVAPASSVGPRTARILPAALLAQLAGCVCFQRIQDQIRTRVSRNDGVNVVRPYVQRAQKPVPDITRFADRSFYALALGRREHNRDSLEPDLGLSKTSSVGWKDWLTVLIVKSIDRSARITMQPRPIRTKRDQVSQRHALGHGQAV